MGWSARQYGKFEAQRNRPIHDLLAQLGSRPVAQAADLGCGPGNSTQILLQYFADAQVTALDSSPDMLEAARQRLPDVSFELADIGNWAPLQRFDLILANASLQWLPDHARLLPALFSQLAPGGSLAVQMPDNLEEPAHRLMREVASHGTWRDRLRDAARPLDSRHSVDWYYDVLQRAGAQVDIWRTVYQHPLQGAAGIVEWFKGSALRPFLARLAPDEQESFLARYEEALQSQYPTFEDGTVLLPFPRLFFIATRT
ncbi:trans-aconitate 2-methyltransferase [Pseudomonas sp. LRF_L74]|uniref:trans-aconitate 2-methyltransferase n=1 Tax=Pseudomonas sp. LRF_L74 TaxID=3369422 RepID=UPI003F636DC6